jgi:hypothetical protein
MSFIYGGDTGLTYEEMRKRREQSDQMRAIADKIAASQQTPTTFGGGLSAIGQAMIARQKGKKADALDAEADAAEKAGRSNASSVFQSILGGGAMSGQPQPASYTPEQSIADDAMAAIGKPQQGGGNVRAGLIKRGMPEHVADAFVMNFKDESNLNPGINEANPIVPGSRGGFGLAQWTGPRRRELEAFAESRGKPVSDMDTQLDFLMTELQGSEKRAAQKIFGAQDTGGAAVAIVNDFLRPAEEHRTKRAQRYMQAGGQHGVQVAQNGPGVEQIMAAMSNPYMSQEQKSALGILLQQKMQESDQMRQMQLEKGQLELQQMRQPANRPLPSGAVELEWRAKQAGLQPGSAEYKAFMLNGSGDPATFRALKLQALDAGLKEGTKEYEDFMASRGAFEQSYSRQAGTNQAQVDSGRQASSAVAAGTVEGRMEAETQAAAGSDMRAGLNALDLLNSIRNDPSREIATGKSSVLGKIPGTGAYDFTQKVEQAKSGAFMTAIQQMRGMGALSNTEGQTARAAVTRMSTSLTEEGFLEALNDYEKIIQQGITKAQQNGATIPQQQAQTFEQFSADPSAQNAARQYGVTLKEMWEIKQGRK